MESGLAKAGATKMQNRAQNRYVGAAAYEGRIAGIASGMEKGMGFQNMTLEGTSEAPQLRL